MKSMLIIAVAVGAVLGGAAALAKTLGWAVHWEDVMLSIAVGAVAGIAGILPMLGMEYKTTYTAAQSALAGTVVHMLVAMGGAMGMLLLHEGNVRAGIAFWLLGAYLVSLIVLIWQLRTLLLAKVGAAQATLPKAQA